MKPSAYSIATYFKGEEKETLEGASEGDIIVLMKDTPENIELAKILLKERFNQRK